jgi:hypothetical protein
MSEKEQHGIFVPLCLVMVALALWFGFQTFQLVKERDTIKNLRANQTAIYDNAQKMRAQLEAIAAEMAKLAQAGNPHATQMVNALKARGITINPDAANKPVAK